MKALRTCGMASLVLALAALPTFAQPAPPPAAATEPAAAPADPLAAFRASGYEAAAAKDRAARREALGISAASSYA